MTEKKAFENNEVLLWGENPVKKSLLEQYDKGNKNPFSTTRKKEPKANEEKKTPIKKTFTIGEDYGIQDLPFLNKEYERIDKELSKVNSVEEMDELSEQQDKLYDLIEGLEHLQKIGGKGIKHYIKEEIIDDDFIGAGRFKGLIGKGFKKGSPEAIAHAEKMRKILEEKNKEKGEKIVRKTISSKARVEKGSEEAKALGKRMAEAKKKKAEEAKKLKEAEEEAKPKEIIKPKGKPWFYIGEIPKGYREATEDEAIMNKRVSYYGKYTVDSEKWRLYKDYDILLTTDKTNKEIEWSMNGLKRRVLEVLREIEILSSKLDNEKYHEKWEEFSHKLENEKEKKKYLQAGYNWYYKLLCNRIGKKYERQKIEIEKPKINKSTKSEPMIYKEPERPIDPRTGKPIEFGELYIDRIKQGLEEPIKEIKNQNIDVDLWFEKDGDNITLSTKYFTPDYKLKPKYAKKLLDKKIILKKKHYTTDDYNKYFYGMTGGNIGYGLVNRKPDIKNKDIVQSVLFDKNYWTINKAKKWLKDNDYYNDEIDEKEKHYRFRQYNPSDLMERHYITKKLNNGIELIISIK